MPTLIEFLTTSRWGVSLWFRRNRNYLTISEKYVRIGGNKLDTWIIMSSPERYKKGAHTVLDIQYHFVKKTKYGYCVLEKQIGQRLRSIIQEICSKNEMSIKQGNIREKIIHLTKGVPRSKEEILRTTSMDKRMMIIILRYGIRIYP